MTFSHLTLVSIKVPKSGFRDFGHLNPGPNLGTKILGFINLVI
jgi:hypothetical protein